MVFIQTDANATRYQRANKEERPGFSKWQEGTRKDIERAFGVLQGKWQCLARPMHQISLEQIVMIMKACLILHNMCVSDRIMDGDVKARYDPGHDFQDNERVDVSTIVYPDDVNQVQGVNEDPSEIGLAVLNKTTRDELVRRDCWRHLNDFDEFVRLHLAIAKELYKADD
jgi:hypothetical protein